MNDNLAALAASFRENILQAERDSSVRFRDLLRYLEKYEAEHGPAKTRASKWLTVGKCTPLQQAVNLKRMLKASGFVSWGRDGVTHLTERGLRMVEIAADVEASSLSACEEGTVTPI